MKNILKEPSAVNFHGYHMQKWSTIVPIVRGSSCEGISGQVIGKQNCCVLRYRWELCDTSMWYQQQKC